jgi:hypothetical protein
MHSITDRDSNPKFVLFLIRYRDGRAFVKRGRDVHAVKDDHFALFLVVAAGASSPSELG